MKRLAPILLIAIGLYFSFALGSKLERISIHAAILNGPRSDDFPPIQTLFQSAAAKIRHGDPTASADLQEAERRVDKIQRWHRMMSDTYP